MKFVAFGVALVAIAAPAFAAGDATAGVKVFQRCAACHSAEPGVNRIGPSLFGVIGRQAGTLPGFPYSLPMLHTDFEWTQDNVQALLAGNSGLRHGGFRGLPDTQDRADVAAYLATLR